MPVHLPVLYYQAALGTRIECSIEATKSWPRTVKCQKGCASCCNRKLEISLAEAIEIVVYLRKMGRWPEVSAKISKIDMDLSLVDPTVYFAMGLQCVLLKNGECRAYEVRPIVCASHYVYSDPALCNANSGKDGNYELSHIMLKLFEFNSKLRKIFESDSVLKRSGWLPFALKAASIIIDHKFESFEDFISVYRGEFQ